jgi:hypothetical protein
MKPLEIHVYDFDGTLYNSPKMPLARPDWWFSSKSLRGWKAPGYDHRWILPLVQEARRSAQAPWAKTALLTGRPLHGEMEATLKRMLSSAGIRFDIIQLKPLLPIQPTPRYKAHKLIDWVTDYPTVGKVVFYDDLDENLDAVGHALNYYSDMTYVPVKAPGLT